VNEQSQEILGTTTDPYLEHGVSSEKTGVHDAIKDFDKGLFPGAFCQILPLPANLPAAFTDQFCQVIHTDGAGTKSNVAYLAMKEGLGLHFLATSLHDAIVMNTDDMACVGICDHINLTNHIDRNANRVNDVVLARLLHGYYDYITKMSQLGITLSHAGGETADVGSYMTTMGLAVTAQAFIERSKVIDCSNIQPGAYIVGLASDGKCSYEDVYNSGIRSNGLTLAIHTLLAPYYRKYTETMDDTIDPEKLFRGVYKLEDKLEGTPLTIAEAILSPTRTYLPVVRDILQDNIPVQGIIHCSGGGLTKSKKFGNRITYVKDAVLDLTVPPIFREIQRLGGISDYYMYQIFNMGIGMEFIVATREDAMRIIQHAAKYDIRAHIIGRTERSADGVNHVKIGENIYNNN